MIDGDRPPFFNSLEVNGIEIPKGYRWMSLSKCFLDEAQHLRSYLCKHRRDSFHVLRLRIGFCRASIISPVTIPTVKGYGIDSHAAAAADLLLHDGVEPTRINTPRCPRPRARPQCCAPIYGYLLTSEESTQTLPKNTI